MGPRGNPPPFHFLKMSLLGVQACWERRGRVGAPFLVNQAGLFLEKSRAESLGLQGKPRLVTQLGPPSLGLPSCPDPPEGKRLVWKPPPHSLGAVS